MTTPYVISKESTMSAHTRTVRLARHLFGRLAVAVVAGALVVSVAACDDQSPSTGSAGGAPPGASSLTPPGTSAASPASTSPVAYSSCMRAHGVPNFPDPDSSGALPKADAQHLGVSTAQLEAAEAACRAALPGTGGSFNQQAAQCIATSDCPQALVQQILNVQRAYAQCMRSHGFPAWPDPTIDAQGRPYFDLSGAGISHAEAHSAKWDDSDGICERLVGPDGNVPVDVG